MGDVTFGTARAGLALSLPPRGTVGPDGIVNGLYPIHIRALDGVDAGSPA